MYNVNIRIFVAKKTFYFRLFQVSTFTRFPALQNMFALIENTFSLLLCPTRTVLHRNH